MSNNLNTTLLTHLKLNSFAYNGMLKDDEVSGNSYTTFFREFDSRLGRWWTIDPKVESQPYQSPYCSMDNNPIAYNDPLGDWVKGAGFWRNVTSSDQQIKAEDRHNATPGSSLHENEDGSWSVISLKTQKVDFKNSKGEQVQKEIVTNATIWKYTEENSNDLTDHHNPIFNFTGLLDYWLSSKRGSMDNYGRLEGTRGLYETTDKMDKLGSKAQYVPVLAPVGEGMQFTADVLNTIADFSTKPTDLALKKMISRMLFFAADKKTSKFIKDRKTLTKGEKYIQGHGVREGIDKLKDESLNTIENN